MANKLSIDNNGIDVQVGELAIVNQKEQTVFGNANRDLILRTLGNVKIQVGSNFYDLSFKTDTQTGDSTLIGATILETADELLTIDYPGDGTIIFTKDTATFYIASDGLYIASNQVDPATNKVYLSYSDSQSLTGEEKQTVLFNTGYILNNISEVTTLAPTDVYANQLVYSLQDGQHYKLINVNSPSEITSWQPVYFTSKGGTITGSLIINASTPVSFEIRGLYLKDFLPQNETQFNGFYLGDNYKRGLGFWWNEDGTFISSQATENGAINFLSGGERMFTIDKANVGVGGINYDYQFYVAGSTYLADKTYSGRGIGTRDFISGINGVGFDIYKDVQGKWNLEVDKLLVRESSQVTDKEYETSPVNGSLILNNSIRFKTVKLVQSLPIYIRKETAGKYRVDGSVLPLKEKGRSVYAVVPPADQWGNPEAISNYNRITLSYGIGDRYLDGNSVTYNTYNKNLDSSLVTPKGTHNYNATTKQFDEVENGSLVLADNINVYAITSDVMKDIEVGDLLYYKQWKADKTNLRVVYAEVVNVDTEGFDLFVYDNQTITESDTLIKIGNINNAECVVQLNAFDKNNPFIEVLSEIESYNDFVDNIFYEDGETLQEDEDYSTAFKKAQIRLRAGWLTDIIDEDLGLDGSAKVGLYSDSVFLKGNFVGEKVIFGTQLNFENDVLTIVDLETIKNRTITGTSGLTGGGTLFDSNIIIKHGTSNWSNKADLDGGNVISNLILDEFGHPTDWKTRLLHTDDIIEGTKLYYTDARVEAFGNTKWSKLGHTHLWVDITDHPTKLSEFENDLGIDPSFDGYTKEEADARFTKRYKHIQTTPSALWDIEHMLNGDADVTIYDSADDIVYADIHRVNENQIGIFFSTPQTGYAIIQV